LNIQRGREHGIPGYNEFRKLAAGLKKSTTIEGFDDSMTKEQIKTLKKVYSHPDDVDLFVGGMYERPLCGAVMGRTFSFLLAEQFRRLRRGDRFWYENPGVFTKAQLKEIRKVTLAKVICDNSDGIRSIQRRVLVRQRGRTSCWKIRRIDLRKWRSLPIHA
jgi:peroxidase